jgi:hypothetical protein
MLLSALSESIESSMILQSSIAVRKLDNRRETRHR